MKKNILLVITIIISNFIIGQNLEFIYENESLQNGDTISVEAGATITEVIVELSVKNISAHGITTLAKRKVFSEVENTNNAFCWGVCYAPSTDMGTVSVSLAIGETNSEFSGHLYNTNRSEGSSLILYTVFNEVDTDDSVSVYVNYKIGDSGTNVLSLNGESKLNYSVYPNPFNDIVNLKFNNSELYYFIDIKVIDVIGRVVKNYEEIKLNNSFQIDLNELNAGIYTILVQQNDNMIAKQIIKR